MHGETYKVLKFLSKQTSGIYVKDLEKRFHKSKFRVPIYEHLEYLVSLGLATHKSIFDGAEVVPGGDNFGHYYRVTINGLSFISHERQERLRFIAPIFVSALVSFAVSYFF